MRFCPWYPLADSASCAPASEGVLQLRLADGLLDYPLGKSAMISYTHASNCRATAAALAMRFAGQDILCRHLEVEGNEKLDAAGTYARVLAEFERRFGIAPTPALPLAAAGAGLEREP